MFCVHKQVHSQVPALLPQWPLPQWRHAELQSCLIYQRTHTGRWRVVVGMSGCGAGQLNHADFRRGEGAVAGLDGLRGRAHRPCNGLTRAVPGGATGGLAGGHRVHPTDRNRAGETGPDPSPPPALHAVLTAVLNGVRGGAGTQLNKAAGIDIMGENNREDSGDLEGGGELGGALAAAAAGEEGAAGEERRASRFVGMSPSQAGQPPISPRIEEGADGEERDDFCSTDGSPTAAEAAADTEKKGLLEKTLRSVAGNCDSVALQQKTGTDLPTTASRTRALRRR